MYQHGFEVKNSKFGITPCEIDSLNQWKQFKTLNCTLNQEED